MDSEQYGFEIECRVGVLQDTQADRGLQVPRVVFSPHGRPYSMDLDHVLSFTQFCNTGIVAGSTGNMLMTYLPVDESKRVRRTHIDKQARIETENALKSLTRSLLFRDEVASETPIVLPDGGSLDTSGFRFPPTSPSQPVCQRVCQANPYRAGVEDLANKNTTRNHVKNSTGTT